MKAPGFGTPGGTPRSDSLPPDAQHFLAAWPPVPGVPALGLHWQDLRRGMRIWTGWRRVTQGDLDNFARLLGRPDPGLCGDAAVRGGTPAGRALPAALTYALVEDLVAPRMIPAPGLAVLEVVREEFSAVQVDDTIHAAVEIMSVCPAGSDHRAFVDTRVDVLDQRGILVMTYTARRSLAGRSTCGC